MLLYINTLKHFCFSKSDNSTKIVITELKISKHDYSAHCPQLELNSKGSNFNVHKRAYVIFLLLTTSRLLFVTTKYYVTISLC